MTDLTKINVGGIPIGIKGLNQVLADLADEFADRSDEDVAEAMLARLEKRNYLAPSARDEYAAAFVREFRKHLGQPYQPDPGQGLEVKVLGPGCARCDQVHERAARALTELGLGANLEAVKDTRAIAAAGVLVTPGLMIGDRVVSVGKVPSVEQIKDWLKDSNQE